MEKYNWEKFLKEKEVFYNRIEDQIQSIKKKFPDALIDERDADGRFVSFIIIRDKFTDNKN